MFDTPDFVIPILKLDIEGHEPFVIEGAKRLLASGMVKNIQTELRDTEQSPQKEAIQLLLATGCVAVSNPKTLVMHKYTRKETLPFLKSQDEWWQKTKQNTDLWFQLESEELPPTLL